MSTGSAQPFEVLIAGGGVAGLEAAFALRELAGDRVKVTVLAPTDDFVYRPLAVGEPFTSAWARHYALGELTTQAGAEHIRDGLAEVDPERRVVKTTAGAELHYQALLVCPGATMVALYEHVTSFDDARTDELLHGLVQDVEGGYVKHLAIVVPAPMPWPFPAYELALMTSERAWDMGVHTSITVLTPETSPLAAFGAEASRAVAELLAERHIEVISAAYCEIPKAQTIVVHPGGRTMSADRIIALPALHGPELAGLPQDGNGFIPIDEYGRVRGVDAVWAAGDATDYPVKYGGVAAQLADTAACSIAASAGVDCRPEPFEPELEGVLLTGGRPRYIRGRPTDVGGGEYEFSVVERGAHPQKIAARYLAPHLADTPASD
ncbi:MAG: FAD-dependent oxidoreductase [Solirubrobacteraceae bacterium]